MLLFSQGWFKTWKKKELRYRNFSVKLQLIRLHKMNGLISNITKQFTSYKHKNGMA